jgi:hypothetical protein
VSDLAYETQNYGRINAKKKKLLAATTIEICGRKSTT